MSVHETEAHLFLELAGPLRLRNAAGRDLTPKARKAQGLLALIGTSPRLRRSRSWLQDKLWSDRGPEQGAASLRQCLTEIRAALGSHADCLRTETGWVAFDPDRVHVCADLAERDAAEDVEFAEGLDIRDPEFESWLRDQRLRSAERWQAQAGGATPEPGDAGALPRPTVGLALTHPSDGEPAEDMVSCFVLDLLAKSLLGEAVADVIDLRAHGIAGPLADAVTSPDCLLVMASSVRNDRARVSLTVQGIAKRVLWADSATFDIAELYEAEPQAVAHLAGRAAHYLHDSLARPRRPRRVAPRPILPPRQAWGGWNARGLEGSG